MIESVAIETDVVFVTTTDSGRSESVAVEPAHDMDPPILSTVSEPPLGWLSIAAEMLAETLIELAADFDREAEIGDERAAGLGLAAVVLRDRAAEAAMAESMRWLDDLTRSSPSADLRSTSSDLRDAS